MSDWGSGFSGQITITNDEEKSIDDWQLEFEFDREISSYWDAQLVEKSGDNYHFEAPSWSRSIPVGQSFAFGFLGNPGNVVDGPQGYVLNGIPLGQLSLGIEGITVDEAEAGTTSAGFEVSLSSASQDTVTVDYVTNDVTASAGSDYQAAAGTVTFSPGEVSKTIEITILADEIEEGSEEFQVVLSNPTGAVISQAAANAVIVDDDGQPWNSSWPDRVFAPYVDATGWPPFDFVATAEEQGVAYYNLGFVVADAATAEPSWGGYYAADGDYLGQEIEALRQLGGDVMVSFGGAANTELAVAIPDVTALTAAYQQVIDAYDLTHIDFDVEGAWLPDQSSVDRRSQAIANLQSDAVASGRELSVWFTLPVLPSGLTPDGTYLIDSALSYGVDVAGVNIMAMDYGDGAAPDPEDQMGEYAIQAAENLHLQLTTAYEAAAIDISAEDLWSKVGVTPMIGLNDVTTETFNQQDARELLAFADSKEIGMISMWSANRDKACENGETYVSPNCSSIQQEPFEFSSIFRDYMESDPATPRLSIAPASVDEGNAGSSDMVFNVTLSATANDIVSVDYQVHAGTATADIDYAASSGTLTFAAGESEKQIAVAVIGDTVDEDDETFTVELLNPQGAMLSVSSATGTICDDDTLIVPDISINDASIEEGQMGNTSLEFIVSLSEAAIQPVSVNFQTNDGAARAGEDYVETAGMLTFSPGETSQTISVDIIGDDVEELNEEFQVVLSGPMNAELADNEGIGTILDDDQSQPPVDFVVTGDWGTGFNADFTVSNFGSVTWQSWNLEFDFDHQIDIIWNAQVVSQSGNRYQIQSESWNGNVAPGSSVSFGIGGFPGNVMDGPTNIVLNGTPISGNDPSLPDIRVSDTSIVESDSGLKSVDFVVSLSHATDVDVTFNYSTLEGTAQAGSDFISVSGSGVIPAGATETSISVEVVGDLLEEPDETFSLLLSSITGAAQTNDEALATIRDDDYSGTASEKRIVGYYTAWSVYGRDYHVSDIPADKLTHINYAFANIAQDGTIALGDPYADIDKYYPGDSWDAGSLRGNFHQLQLLKEQHPHLQTMISVGGWTWSGRFSDIALTEASRELFVTSTVDFMKEYGFDGIDIDWEYPVSGGLGSNVTRPEDKQNYTLLMAEFREQLDELELQDGRDYWLSIAAPAGPAVYANLEIQQLGEHLDWINIMAYDLHGGWSPMTNHQSGLYASSGDPSPDPVVRNEFNSHAAVQAYLNAGVPSDKLVLGGAFYGRGWKGVPNVNHGLYQSHTGVPQGTWEPGVFDYRDLRENYLPTYQRHWDDEAKAPWLYNPDTGIMISYDDPESLGHRAQYIVDQNLGGMMFWELSADDDDSSLLNAVFDTFTAAAVSNVLNIDSGSGMELTTGSLLDSELDAESSLSSTSTDQALVELIADGMETPVPPDEREEEDPVTLVDDAFAEGDLVNDPLLDPLTSSSL